MSCKKQHIGGQAVIEGVLIVSPKKISIAVRTEKGKIKTLKQKRKPFLEKYPIFKIPFVRGIFYLIEMLVTGMKALTWSSEQQGEEEKLGFWGLFITFGLAIILTIGLFIILPYFLSKIFFNPPSFSFNLLDGFFRLLVFFGYLVLIGQMKDVKRMFQYHGAEHKAVHCYEAGKKLTVKNVRRYAKEHARCGTSFLIYVIVISILLFSVIKTGVWYWNILFRILLIPVVAGISYELLKISSKYQEFFLFRWLVKPGIWTQKLTTRKPTDKQLEVGIKAVKGAL